MRGKQRKEEKGRKKGKGGQRGRVLKIANRRRKEKEKIQGEERE